MATAMSEQIPQTWPVRLARLAPAFACPKCRTPLVCGTEFVACQSCGARFPLRGGRLYFIEVPERTDHLDDLKASLKKLLGRYYYSVGLKLLAPTFPTDFRGAVRRHLDPSKELVVDLGCGNRRVDPDLIGVDIFDYEAVDIVCDLMALPFRDGTIDGFVSSSVLEHVPNLSQAAGEIDRCTRRGGVGVHLIPFLFPYHASPHDYQRLTHTGAACLMPGWTTIEQRNATGPVTLFLVCVIEFLAILFSFGYERVKAPLYLA